MSSTTYETKLKPAIDNHIKFEEELNRIKKHPQNERSKQADQKTRDARRAAFKGLEAVLMLSDLIKAPADYEYLERRGKKAIPAVERLLEAEQVVWIEAATAPANIHSGVKSKSEKLSWVVTLLQIAIEWGFDEDFVQAAIPDGSVDERSGFKKTLQQAYMILARMNTGQ